MNARDIPPNRLYDEFAYLWPLMSPPEDYAAEALFWRTVLHNPPVPGRRTLLELGVGGGHLLSHLAGDFDLAAVDLSPAMLDQCRRLLPGVKLHCGDMRTVRLGRTFDAVVIHDAIGHMLTEADLLAAFQTAAAHLKPGGIFVTAADRYREQFTAPETETATRSDGRTTFTYFQYDWLPDPAGTVVETLLTYLIQTPGDLRIEHDRMQTGLFPRATWLRLLAQAGFSVTPRSFSLPGWPRPYELLAGIRSHAVIPDPLP
jgi:SAM-dependent methyltransferase